MNIIQKRNIVSLRLTRRGRLLRKVREHYLRDSVSCGSLLCLNCPLMNDSNPSFVPSLPLSREAEHYLIIDTLTILSSIHIIDRLDNIIFLETNLLEIRNRDVKIYKKILQILNDSSKHCYLFPNEHSAPLYTEAISMNGVLEDNMERNHRAIAITVDWYRNHLNKPILFLSYRCSDPIESMTMEEYINKHHDELKDLCIVNEMSSNSEKEYIYPPYLPIEDAIKGVDSKKFLKGMIRISKYDSSEGVINCDNNTIILKGALSLNRAIDGDIVIVELLPESSSNLVVEDSFPIPISSNVSEGKVISVLQRNWRIICGSVDPSSFIPSIAILIDDWPYDSKFPIGHIVKKIGLIGDINVETSVLLIEHSIRDVPWNESILHSLSTIQSNSVELASSSPTKIDMCNVKLISPPTNLALSTLSPNLSLNHRLDIRHFTICSIDPVGCTDIDDALSCNILSNGNYLVGVHIADVTHYVEPSSPIDKEAQLRCNSVYLVNRRIDMLPSLLSSDLCSLIEGVDRFAFSAFFEMNSEGMVISKSFFKTVIKVIKNFSYYDAQSMLNLDFNSSKYDEEIVKSIRLLNSLAKKRLFIRKSEGALFLESLQLKFTLNENQLPSEVSLYSSLESNSLVEEFMLLANIEVASFLNSRFPEVAFLRRHPLPDPKRFLPLIAAISNIGYKLDISNSLSIDNSIKTLSEKFPDLNIVIRFLITRCLSQAKYFLAGDFSVSQFLHYGLAVSYYSHFTSPIRRYSDIIIHRQLFAALTSSPLPDYIRDKNMLRKIAEDCNYHHTQAQLLSRDSSSLYNKMFFKSSIITKGIIIGFRPPKSIIVLLMNYGIECMLSISEDSALEYDSSKMRLIFKNSSFQIFDSITVSVSCESGSIVVKLALDSEITDSSTKHYLKDHSQCTTNPTKKRKQ